MHTIATPLGICTQHTSPGWNAHTVAGRRMKSTETSMRRNRQSLSSLLRTCAQLSSMIANPVAGNAIRASAGSSAPAGSCDMVRSSCFLLKTFLDWVIRCELNGRQPNSSSKWPLRPLVQLLKSRFVLLEESQPPTQKTLASHTSCGW